MYKYPVSYTHLDVYKRQIINIATRKEGEEPIDSIDDDPNSTQEKCITPEEGFSLVEESYVSLLDCKLVKILYIKTLKIFVTFLEVAIDYIECMKTQQLM